MALILCRLCGELVNSDSERCKCGGSTRQTSTLATSPSDSNVDRWQKKYASPLSAPPSLPSSSSSTVQPLPPTSLAPPPSPSLNKTYGSLLSLSAPLSCVSCTRPFPPDATLYPAKAPAARPNYFDPPEEETYKCRACYTKEDSLGGCEKCGRAVLGVKEIGKSEGQFVKSGKKVWCQGCFSCDGCSTLLRPSPSKPPLLHPITGKPICEDCLFNPPQSPASSSGSSRRPLPQRTTLTSSSSNLGGFGPSPSTSSLARDAAQPNAAVEELRTRLGITSLRSSASLPAVPTRGEPSPASATRPPPLPASASYNGPRPSTATNLKSPTSSFASQTPRSTLISNSSSPSNSNSSCPTCLAPLTSPPATSAASARRSPYDRTPPPAPVTSIALITLPAQLGGQTYHAVCFRCDGCGDSLVAAEGEDKEVGVGVNERGKGVCLKCVKPTRFSVSLSSSTRSIPSPTTSAAPSVPASARPHFQSNPTPPPPLMQGRSAHARPLQTAGNERVPTGPASPVSGGGPKKLGGSILERAGVKKRVD